MDGIEQIFSILNANWRTYIHKPGSAGNKSEQEGQRPPEGTLTCSFGSLIKFFEKKNLTKKAFLLSSPPFNMAGWTTAPLPPCPVTTVQNLIDVELRPTPLCIEPINVYNLNDFSKRIDATIPAKIVGTLRRFPHIFSTDPPSPPPRYNVPTNFGQDCSNDTKNTKFGGVPFRVYGMQ